MNVSLQIESVSTEFLLAGLNLAIYEAKLVRSIIKSKDYATRLESRNPVPRKLMLLNREIELLEVKLARVRSQANHKDARPR